MRRAQRLQSLWNWLPTYRAVAEVQHVSRAAKRLGVSPSAVSRMIALLEHDVGQPLFERAGRNVRLNDAGEHLLAGVRSAMRLLDESLALIADRQFVGPVSIAAEEPFARALLWPTVAILTRRHPGLLPTVRRAPSDDVGSELLQGSLDIAFVRDFSARPQLSLRKLVSLEMGVYAGAGHPLFDAARCSLDTVAKHPFVEVGMSSRRRSTALIGWPRERERRVVAFVSDFDFVLDAVTGGRYLGVLPVMLAEHATMVGAVRRVPLPSGALVKLDLFAAWREQLELPGRVEAVVRAAMDAVGAHRSAASVTAPVT